MVFSSALFLFLFLPITLFFYFISNDKFKNIILLCSSLFFYAWGEPKYIVLMLISIIVNYYLGIMIEKANNYAKLFVFLSVLFNIGILYYFKYFDFSLSLINRVFKTSLNYKNIALPIGISFFTFQIMSYVIDVYNKKTKAQRNILNLALYISMFPQLIAGPIVRYVDIEKQLNSRTTNINRAYEGAKRFIIGFSKKILIADQLSPLVSIAFSQQYESMYINWIGMIAYTLQIYYDFSGYSDMAIGIGKIIGFDFPENFNYPYISSSIQEFWRRWHITLGDWFKNYLYIPLGGNRKGELRTYLNLLIVFAATGIWHGASLNFLAWGLYYALFQIFERTSIGEKYLSVTPTIIRRIITIVIVMFGWVLFRAEGLLNSIIYIKNMFVHTNFAFNYFDYVINNQYIFCLIVGIVFSFPYTKIKKTIENNKVLSLFMDIIIVLMFLVSISYMLGSGYSPFLYFRF